ncbi:MAG TPA: hypothetical protein PLD40_06995 [Kiritimatiellia bacterium]|jgi:hypothetical protein|nr:MAG: hypothetical protein BWX54_00368 [Verrucomicrobia bacterium ADurb.Bin018]HOE00468.1 hypothetical protein [Kiritimatiellia bacterium]HOE37336.1 hypothetical protein [Kiritimatiellia bacterium]HOR74726.1 hypothetical protein [Kiritimatiellia bacterium]HOU59267.1 hypothetical protein [Kiritimatiellia bacterium]
MIGNKKEAMTSRRKITQGFKVVKDQEVGAASTQPGFPTMIPSVSADQSFARELARLQSLSIEARIEEALTMKEQFAWLNPVIGDTEP